MARERRFQVFISSTYTDLIEERQAAMRAVLELGHFPAGMEQFSAGDADAWSLIKRVIEESDFYMLIIGGRYGSTDVNGVSFTEREYDYATSLGKSVIPLLHKEPSLLPRQRTEASDAAWEKLLAFVCKVKQRHTCSFWETAQELRACSMAGLLATAQRAQTGGWVKAEINSSRERPPGKPATEPAQERLVSLQEAMTRNVESIDRLYSQETDERTEGFSTGLLHLDRITGGLRPGEVVTLAARPSMGKTTLGLSLLSAVSIHGLPSLVVSPKHSAEDISKRLLTLHGGLNAIRVFSGNVSDDEWPKMVHSIQTLNDATVVIQDSPLISLSDIRETCLLAKNRFGKLGMVLIDAAHYIPTHTESGMYLGAELKRLAREMRAVVLITTNVTQELEQRPNKRPVLRDLPTSTGLAEESDVLVFLYDDRFYNYESLDAGTIELIIAKNALGPLGTIRVKQFGAYHSYGDMSV
jgi:hypothetical protein